MEKSKVSIVISSKSSTVCIPFKCLELLDSFTMRFNNFKELLDTLNSELNLGLNTSQLSYNDISVNYVYSSGLDDELGIRYANDYYDEKSLKETLYEFLLSKDMAFQSLKQNGMNIESYFLGNGVATEPITNRENSDQLFLKSGVSKFIKYSSPEEKKTVVNLLANYHLYSQTGAFKDSTLEEKLLSFLGGYHDAFKVLRNNGINMEDYFIGLGVSNKPRPGKKYDIELFLRTGIEKLFSRCSYKIKRDLYFILCSYGFNTNGMSKDVSSDGLTPEVLDELSKLCDLRTLEGDLTIHSHSMSDAEIADYIASLIGIGRFSPVFDGQRSSCDVIQSDNGKKSVDKKIRKALIACMGVDNITKARAVITKNNNPVRRRD